MGDFSGTLGDMSLPDRLECVYTLSVLLADLHDFAKAPLSDDLEKVERIDCQRLVACLFEIDLEVERTGTCSGAIPLVRCVLYGGGKRMKKAG